MDYNRWIQIVTDENDVKRLLDNVSSAIISSKNENFGLNNGNSGKILFMLFFYEYTHRNEILDYIIHSSYDVIEKMHNTKSLNASISTGLSGVLFVFEHLVEKGFLPQEKFRNTEIDLKMHNTMLHLCKTKNYDFLLGALGIALYLFRKKNYNSVDVFLDIVRKDFQKSDRNWYSIVNNEYDNKPVINLGFAHGLSGMLAFISLAKIENAYFDKYFEFSHKIVEFLLSKLNRKGRSQFPSIIFYDGKRNYNYSRLSWCYGDLCVGYAILLFSEAFDKPYYREVALQILLKTTSRTDLYQENILDACLCHGTSGLAHIYNRIYQHTLEEKFKTSSIYWYKQTFKMSTSKNELAGFTFNLSDKETEFINSYSFLNGISGVGLSMLSGISDIYPSWDRLLFLS